MLTHEDRRFLEALAGAIDRLCDDTSIIKASTSRIRTILASPPTVADLYEQIDAKHAVEWTATAGERMRIRREAGSPVTRDHVEYYSTTMSRWREAILGPADMNQSATLVEVPDDH